MIEWVSIELVVIELLVIEVMDASAAGFEFDVMVHCESVSGRRLES